MAVLVDDARWPWRGHLWCHLVSDDSRDELHDFAHQLGLRRMGFQGDHYDLAAGLRQEALAAGALGVESRELVRRLRAAGLRRRPGPGPGHWQEVARWERGELSTVSVQKVLDRLGDQIDAGRAVAGALDEIGIAGLEALDAMLFARRVGVALVAQLTTPSGAPPPVRPHEGRAIVVVHRPPHPWLVEVIGSEP